MMENTAKNGLRVGFIAVSLLFLFVLPASAYSNINNGDFNTNLTGWSTSGIGSWGGPYAYWGGSCQVNYYSTGSYDNSGNARVYCSVWNDDGEGGSTTKTCQMYQTVDVTGYNTLYFWSKGNLGRVYIGSKYLTIFNTSWNKYSIDVSDLTGSQTLKAYASSTAYDDGPTVTHYVYVDHFYFDSDEVPITYDLSCSPYPLYKTDSTVNINLTTENAYSKTVNLTAYGHTGSVYGEIDSTSLGIATNNEITQTVFSFPLVDSWDYITVEAEADGEIVDTLNATIYNNYVDYNPDGSYNFNVGDEYNPGTSGLIDYYVREIYEDGTIVYTELDSQSGTITPTYPGGEHGDLISVTIVETFAGQETQIIDTLNSTEEFDYIDYDANTSQVWYDFGELWGLPGYTYFVKIFYFPPGPGETWAPDDQIIQVYSQSGYVTVDYPEYFDYASAYFKVDGDSYLVDQSTRDDSYAPEVNPDDEDDEDDNPIDNLDPPDAPDGPDSDSDSDSPFPDPLENESENNDTWPEAPNVPEIINVPGGNETNVTVVTDNTTSGYYSSVNESINGVFAPAHAFANYVSSPFNDAAGSLYIVSTSLGGQDLSDSQEVADDLGSGVKAVFPLWYRLFGSVVICLAIVSMMLRGSNE